MPSTRARRSFIIACDISDCLVGLTLGQVRILDCTGSLPACAFRSSAHCWTKGPGVAPPASRLKLTGSSPSASNSTPARPCRMRRPQGLHTCPWTHRRRSGPLGHSPLGGAPRRGVGRRVHHAVMIGRQVAWVGVRCPPPPLFQHGGVPRFPIAFEPWQCSFDTRAIRASLAGGPGARPDHSITRHSALFANCCSNAALQRDGIGLQRRREAMDGENPLGTFLVVSAVANVRFVVL